ncbi:DNA-binding protein [Vampirovibrio chlorellavorus]|uniref:DNA-binding protein n=1 Tax=Vampirovibrio chlorellavorus TaxID=758823 RepID=UPI0026F0D880|nr:DNA-binding protein [Vampirovibrio chlorellavorus]
MRFAPRYRINPPSVLYASAEEEGCGIDPRTGEYTCTARAERSPDPEPDPNPDPEPEPESDPESAAQIDKTFVVALFSMLADTIASALTRPLTFANEEPLTLPARPRPPLPVVEPLPLRAIPEAAPLPSARLNPMVGDRLQTLRNQVQVQLQERWQANQQATQKGEAIAKGIVEASQQPPLPINDWPSSSPSSVAYSSPEPASNSLVAQAFQNLFNPSVQQFIGPIQEDSGWIQANIAHASKPVGFQEQLQATQNAVWKRQQVEAQQAYYQAQIELAQAQRRAIELQNWANEQATQRQARLIASSGEIVTDVPDNLIAESGSVSLRYKPPKSGEKAIGPKSNFPPKPIYFNNDQELSDKIWYHFLNGEGQPVEINLAKLDFSNDINMPKLFSAQLRQFLSNPDNLKRKDRKAIIERLSGKKLEDGFPVSNGKVAYLTFKDVFTDVEPNLDKTILPGKFAAFGRMLLNVKNPELLIDYSKQIVTLQARIYPIGKKGELDRFDFDNDPRRGIKWNLGTEIVHRTAPPGSTSYNIYGRGSGLYKKTYKIQDFIIK